jgi:ATP-dependent Clp protease adapter protein ClpS
MRTNQPIFNNHRKEISTYYDIIGSNTSQILQCLLLLTVVSPLCFICLGVPTVLKVQSFTSSSMSPHSSSRFSPIMNRSYRREGCSSSQGMLMKPPMILQSRTRQRMEPIYFKEDKSEDSDTESSSRQKRDTGSHVQTKERVDVENLLRQKHDLREDEPILWRVLLHNDHIHTFSYVVQSIVKVVGILTRAQAWEVVVHAHANDRATICKVWKSKAEQFCLGLQRQGLTASIVPDYEFNYYDYLRHQLGSTATSKKRDRERVQN